MKINVRVFLANHKVETNTTCIKASYIQDTSNLAQ